LSVKPYTTPSFSALMLKGKNVVYSH